MQINSDDCDQQKLQFDDKTDAISCKRTKILHKENIVQSKINNNVSCPKKSL